MKVGYGWITAWAFVLLAGVAPVAVAQQTPQPAPRDTIRVEPGGEPDAVDQPAVGPAEEEGAEVMRPPLSARADSIAQRLRNLPGHTVTEYRGDRAVYRTDAGTLRLEGDAEVVRAGDRLTADTIEYRERHDLIEATGNARVVGDEQDLEGQRLIYELARRRASVLGARTQITQQATWYFTGDAALEGTHSLWGRGHFTSCDLEIPHYHFEANEVFALRDRILVARGVRLYFGDVPVMVLPFLVQNLERGRRSGFLTPKFGMNDIVRSSSGYNRQISDLGFFWAINDFMGAELATTWRSGAYTALQGNVSYNWRRQFLRGNFGLDRYWRETGGRELSLNTQTSWEPDERTSLSLTGRYASSSQFVRDISYDPFEAMQDLSSNFALGRRFDWGRLSLGADRRQSIATGDVTMTLPSFSISPQGITLFRAATPESERWYSNASFTPGVISGSRATNQYADNIRARQQDRETTQFRASPSFSIGNLTVGLGGNLNRSEVREAAGLDREGEMVVLPGFDRDEASWSASASYRQQLVGTTSIAPTISFNQQLVRDTLTEGEFLGAPRRMSFGAGLNTDLYGFFPGFGGFSAIRHRLSPRISYSYAPEVRQTARQEDVFGRAGGRAQNRVSLSINQSWEAKLRTPTRPEEPVTPQDTLAGETIPQARIPSVPSDPEKVTLLSLTTSPFEYDFIKAREEGSGFLTNMVSNSISSDFLRGLTIQMQHELFDRSEVDPALSGAASDLGRFAPQLSSLSTSFQLGPQSTLVQWIERLAFAPRNRPGQREGVLPEDPPAGEPAPAGQGPFTGNPQGTGAGPWSVNLSYAFNRPQRTFTRGLPLFNEPTQTLDGNMSFQLTPNWSVNWSTSYSISDRDFGLHRLNFRRDLHEWQANFNFFQTPTGNTGFEFFVELTHNRDIRFEHSERRLGVDRAR